MIEKLLALIVDEGKWLTASMTLALLTVGALSARRSFRALPSRRRIGVAMNLFFAVTIGTMAFGHLLAVTTKLASGTLRGSAPLLYAIGIVLAVPSWCLIAHTRRMLREDANRRTLVLNGLVATSLIALGLPNIALALPAFLNMAYAASSRRSVAWAVAGVAVVLQVALFVGSLVFLASGQTFEQFSGVSGQ